LVYAHTLFCIQVQGIIVTQQFLMTTKGRVAELEKQLEEANSGLLHSLQNAKNQQEECEALDLQLKEQEHASALVKHQNEGLNMKIFQLEEEINQICMKKNQPDFDKMQKEQEDVESQSREEFEMEKLSQQEIEEIENLSQHFADEQVSCEKEVYECHVDLDQKAAELQTCKMRLHTANVELIGHVQAMEAKDEELIFCQSATEFEEIHRKLQNYSIFGGNIHQTFQAKVGIVI